MSTRRTLMLLAGCAAVVVGVPACGASEPHAPAPGRRTAPREAESKPSRSPPCPPTAPPGEGRAIVLDRGPEGCRAAALTFDAGADRGHAASILDTLRERHVEATFGVTGEWAQANQDLVRRMAREGHQVINHTWSHRSLARLDDRTRQVELERTERLLRRLTGRTTRPYFRPPYGELNSDVLAAASESGYPYAIMWTIDSLGWMHLSASAIVGRCLSRARAGAIYLFHVGEQSEDAVALGRIIDGLRERGFRFATVADMLPARYATSARSRSPR